MEDSIFTKIIKGEIPCHKIYEDELTLAFLDINPATEGHTLVIPKRQVEFVWDLSDDDYAALVQTVKKVARHLCEISDKPHVGEIIEGMAVPHAHIHLIPFATSAELANAFGKPEVEPDHEQLARTAAKFRFDA